MEKEHIQNIIHRMTLREKIDLCTGKNSWRTRDYEHLGIPSILMSDGTNGVRFQIGSDEMAEQSFYEGLGGKFDDEDAMQRTHRATCFPSGSAVACTWDKELIGRMGREIAGECKALGINLLLGPGMNIRRHPLTARNFEYYSEDPVLTGEMAAAIVGAVQSEGVGTCMKHFACHNSDTRRTRVNVHVSERALREIYLAGYERVIQKAQPVSLMSAYNQINGEEVSGDNRVTRDILRKEWGFEGAVICDWGAVKDPAAASRGTIDLQMPLSKSSAAWLEERVKKGELEESLIDQRVEHILSLVFKLKAWQQAWQPLNAEDGHGLAVEAAADAMVLLKNEDHILPLKPAAGQKVAVIGDMAKHPLYQGTGCAIVHARQVDIPWDCMQPWLADCQVRYAKGYEADGSSSESLLREAEACAAAADVVLLFAGAFLPLEDDDYNRRSIRLLPDMEQLIERVAAVNHRCVVILAGGDVCEMPWRHQVQALLLSWFTGEGMGEAVTQLLFGRRSPSGRLAATIPERLCDTPAYLSFDGNIYDITYAEDIYVGYRYYDKKQVEPAYPFGYGLSYSRFGYSHLTVKAYDDQVRVFVDVTNEGEMAAKEVVQLYIAPGMASRLPRPVRELKAFDKVYLLPGETKQVTFVLTNRDFSYYDPAVSDWVMEGGSYAVEIGRSSREMVLSCEVTRRARRPKQKLAYDCGFYELFSDPRAKALFYEFMVEQGLVTKEQVDEQLEKSMVWSFWPVRSFLDMNSGGAVSFEAFNAFIDKVNTVLESHEDQKSEIS